MIWSITWILITGTDSKCLYIVIQCNVFQKNSKEKYIFNATVYQIFVQLLMRFLFKWFLLNFNWMNNNERKKPSLNPCSITQLVLHQFDLLSTYTTEGYCIGEKRRTISVTDIILKLWVAQLFKVDLMKLAPESMMMCVYCVILSSPGYSNPSHTENNSTVPAWRQAV